jgi:ribonuclease VapC
VIIDSSAIVAILKREPDWREFAERLNSSDEIKISAATYLEVSVLIGRLNDPVMNREIDELLAEFDISIEPFTAEQAGIARQAYRDYGRGSGHRANLNFGDCFAYALARVKREPLLYKGDDFVHTDIRSAMQQS